MRPTRYVLKDEVEPIASELLEITKLSSLSELTSLMYSRYGRHLKATWEIQPTDSISEPLPDSAPISSFSDSIDF